MSLRSSLLLGLLLLFFSACGSPQGKPCTAAADCGSAGQCVDGVCCASACDGVCMACSKAKTGEADGTCAPVLTGTDPESECAAEPSACRGDVCDGAGACAPATAATVCRASRGTCDAAETCDGRQAQCPADGLAPTTVVCRASAGTCDVEERCTGTSADCPSDLKQPSTTVCRPSAGSCDVAETCDAMRSDCPPDAVAPSTVTCRSAAGPCDVAEQCTGTSPLFELSMWGGAVERRYRKLRPEVENLPWGSLDLSRASPAAVLAARSTWTEAAFQEKLPETKKGIRCTRMSTVPIAMDLPGVGRSLRRRRDLLRKRRRLSC